MKKQTLILITIPVLTICFAVAFYALGWTEPTMDPPSVTAINIPLNTGAGGQSKEGGLFLHTSPSFEEPGQPNGLIVSYGRVGIGIDNPSMELQVNGDISGDGFYYSSDINLKKNILTISNPLERVLNLRGVSFEWKDDGKKDIGLIAQEVEQVFPELVWESNGLKSVEYANLVAVLIEAMKEQQSQIEELRQEIEGLKSINK